MRDAETEPLPLFTTRSWAVAGAAAAGTGLPQPLKADVTQGLELFQAAPEAAADGYAAWKAAMAEETAAAETRKRSSELRPRCQDTG